MLTSDTKQYINKRIAATLIDYAVVFGITFLFVFTVGEPDEEGGYSVTGGLALVPFLFWFVFIVVLESKFGGTLGHQLMKLKVVTLDNRTPDFGQTLLRRISDVLEIAWCFGLIAYILVNNSDRNQRLGDIWAKTIVVGINHEFENNNFDFEKGN